MEIGITDHSYCTRFKEADWNGIPAYVEYLRDVTAEVRSRKEKERLEVYFRTVVKKLSGGVIVIRYEKSGKLIPEFMSEGFVAMTGRTEAEMMQIYQKEMTGCLHPDDKERTRSLIQNYIETEKGPCEVVYRMIRGDGTYLWVKNTLSVIQSDGGGKIIYAGYIDITKEQKEKEHLRSQYSEMLMQH